jgi:HD superfamily phosphohydrolase
MTTVIKLEDKIKVGDAGDTLPAAFHGITALSRGFKFKEKARASGIMMKMHGNHRNKVFNDPIHGHIDLSYLSKCLIDTPQFQRLRDISQLGGTYYVFTGASSHRFEHCIGVAHLARQYVYQLKQNQPELDITDIDIICIEIAGLIHDLGHGPFSHLYDGKFLPAILGNHDFQHEHASVGIFELMLEENKLFPIFYESGLTDNDIHFIKELMLGDISDAPPGFIWKGRGEKTFLYDIVANKRNGIDVDKFDYFARDCWMLGLTKSFDSTRLMKFARVFPVSPLLSSPSSTNCSTSSELHICFHVKEAWNIFELFHTRYTLHKRAYQHRVSNAIELMVVEVLKLANDYLFIPGKDKQMRKMSECANDYHAYWRLTEYILKMIENSIDEVS